MNNVEKAVLQHEVGDVSPHLSIRSATRVDAGRWWRPVPLWLLVLDDQLVLLAAGRRRFVGRIPFSEAGESHYDYQKGELVIAPCEELPVNHIAIKASEAIRVLRFLGLDT
jgi:hypothetical protein